MTILRGFSTLQSNQSLNTHQGNGDMAILRGFPPCNRISHSIHIKDTDFSSPATSAEPKEFGSKNPWVQRKQQSELSLRDQVKGIVKRLNTNTFAISLGESLINHLVAIADKAIESFHGRFGECTLKVKDVWVEYHVIHELSKHVGRDLRSKWSETQTMCKEWFALRMKEELSAPTPMAKLLNKHLFEDSMYVYRLARKMREAGHPFKIYGASAGDLFDGQMTSLTGK